MTKYHTDPDATPTSQDPFWNDDADWTPSAMERRSPRVSVGAGATVTRWWDSLLGGDAPAGRAHGVSSSGPRRASAGGASGSDHGSWHLEPTPRRTRGGGLDPNIARIGGLIVAISVAVPLILGFTSSPDGDTLKTADAAPTTTITIVTIAPIDVSQSDQLPSEATAASAPATVAQSTGVQAGAATSDSSSDAGTSTAATSPSSSSSTSAGPVCGNSYEIAAGDYWIRLADAADVRLADLLAVNNASTDTELLPGRSICLPAGASTPAPPTTAPPTTAPPTTAPPTTAAPRPTTTSRPTTTNPPATNAPTTNAPATTRPPTTTSQSWSSSDVEEIIRSVWPDHLEERALTIAWRESSHRPDAYNGHCCYGLFQIYYSVHRSWLTAYGVNQASDLYDPWKNARAAYGLYQRAGGWGPWSQTNH